MFKTEVELEEVTIPYIKMHFIHWSWQIPSYSYVIDFGGINCRNELIGIEYKLHDWKQAIIQAYHHRLTFKYVYILMPMRKKFDNMREEAKKYGV